MGCQDEALVEKVCEMYEKISRLESLKPSKDVNMLFTQLVLTCMPPSPIDVTKLCKAAQDMRAKLIRLCGEAEALLEQHFSTLLASFDTPLDHLTLFPYFSNYLKLSLLEHTILTQHYCTNSTDTTNTTTTTDHHVPTKVAFIGSGPLPLTSIVLASYHLTTTTFHNYDIDPLANSMAARLVKPHKDLSSRMFFHTTDIMNVTSQLRDYEVVFLAALVGMDRKEKVAIIEHLAKHMAPGAILMLRSAHGARAFLYPVVEPGDLQGFEVLSTFHPMDEVINSVVVARKFDNDHDHDHQGIDIATAPTILLPTKCSDQIQPFNNPLNLQLNMMEELAIDQEHHL